jgi:iron-sulfur cluster repair protein YtfE (RIC family)
MMNAIDLILSEHKRIKHLLSISYEMAKGMPSKRKTIITNLGKELVLHETMEQKIWYPYLDVSAYKKTITHLKKEEKSASKAINKLKKMNANSDAWIKGLKKLKDDVLHHAKDEESKLLPKVKENISPKLLKLIGDEMQAFKNKSEKKAGSKKLRNH